MTKYRFKKFAWETYLSLTLLKDISICGQFWPRLNCISTCDGKLKEVKNNMFPKERYALMHAMWSHYFLGLTDFSSILMSSLISSISFNHSSLNIVISTCQNYLKKELFKLAGGAFSKRPDPNGSSYSSLCSYQC